MSNFNLYGPLHIRSKHTGLSTAVLLCHLDSRMPDTRGSETLDPCSDAF